MECLIATFSSTEGPWFNHHLGQCWSPVASLLDTRHLRDRTRIGGLGPVVQSMISLFTN